MKKDKTPEPKTPEPKTLGILREREIKTQETDYEYWKGVSETNLEAIKQSFKDHPADEFTYSRPLHYETERDVVKWRASVIKCNEILSILTILRGERHDGS